MYFVCVHVIQLRKVHELKRLAQFWKNSTQYGSPVFLTQGLTTWSYQQDHCATSAVVLWCSSVAAVPPHKKSPVSGSALQRIVGLRKEYGVSVWARGRDSMEINGGRESREWQGWVEKVKEGLKRRREYERIWSGLIPKFLCFHTTSDESLGSGSLETSLSGWCVCVCICMVNYCVYVYIWKMTLKPLLDWYTTRQCQTSAYLHVDVHWKQAPGRDEQTQDRVAVTAHSGKQENGKCISRLTYTYQ